MNLHAFMDCSLVNGPGRRSVLWFQGCELRCSGCWNPDSHSRHTRLPGAAASELASRVLAAHARYGTEGVTLSGGEPVHQIEGITEMLRLLKRVAPALSVGLFSGYTAGELVQGKFETYRAFNNRGRQDLWTELLGLLDFAVLGRFNPHQPCSEAMITSRNQQLHVFSPRYKYCDFEEQRLEVSIGFDGLTQITGFPTLGILD